MFLVKILSSKYRERGKRRCFEIIQDLLVFGTKLSIKKFMHPRMSNSRKTSAQILMTPTVYSPLTEDNLTE